MSKVPKMTIVFVEDMQETIDPVITTLETSKYFEVVLYNDYDLVPESRMKTNDLFVLDVLTKDGDEPFTQFIRSLRLCERPFIAFTSMNEHGKLPSMAGEPQLRRTVFEYGGLGMVSKYATAGQERTVSKPDLQMDLIERIMNFYWTWRFSYINSHSK